MAHPDTSEPNGPRFAIPLWLWGAALAACLFFALTLWQAQKLQRQLTALQLQMRLEQGRRVTLEVQRRQLDQIRALLAAPETRAVLLKPVSAKMPLFKIFWNEQINVLVTAQNVPIIPAGRVFQLWVVPKKGAAISVGTFQPESNGSVLTLRRLAQPIGIRDAFALTITMEPAGGSPQPTSKPAWLGPIN